MFLQTPGILPVDPACAPPAATVPVVPRVCTLLPGFPMRLFVLFCTLLSSALRAYVILTADPASLADLAAVSQFCPSLRSGCSANVLQALLLCSPCKHLFLIIASARLPQGAPCHYPRLPPSRDSMSASSSALPSTSSCSVAPSAQPGAPPAVSSGRSRLSSSRL